MDPFIEKEIFDQQIYDKIDPDDQMIDGGSHIGLSALYFAGQKGNVTAIEPDRRNLELLRSNIDLNPDLSIKVIPNPLWYREGYVNFHTVLNSGNNSIVPYGFDRNILKLRAIPLNDLLPTDDLKLDVEGSEYQIIKYSDINKVRKRIMLEYHKHVKDFEIEFEILKYKIKLSGFKITRLEDHGYNGYLSAKRV